MISNSEELVIDKEYPCVARHPAILLTAVLSIYYKETHTKLGFQATMYATQ